MPHPPHSAPIRRPTLLATDPPPVPAPSRPPPTSTTPWRTRPLAPPPAPARSTPGSPRSLSRTSPPAEPTATTMDSRHPPRALHAPRHGHRHLRQGRAHRHRPATSARRLAGIGPGGALQRTQRAAGGHHAVQEAPLHRYLKEMKIHE